MSSATDFWLLDLAGIRFSWSKGSSCLSIYSSRLEVLGVVQLDPELSTEEMALRGLDEVLANGRVERVQFDGRVVFPIALYNPFTSQVAVGAIPLTRTYSDRAVIDMDDDGCRAKLVEEELYVDERCLPLVPVGPGAVSRAKLAHEESYEPVGRKSD
jgi:hypothetical protein